MPVAPSRSPRCSSCTSSAQSPLRSNRAGSITPPYRIAEADVRCTPTTGLAVGIDRGARGQGLAVVHTERRISARQALATASGSGAPDHRPSHGPGGAGYSRLTFVAGIIGAACGSKCSAAADLPADVIHGDMARPGVAPSPLVRTPIGSSALLRKAWAGVSTAVGTMPAQIRAWQGSRPGCPGGACRGNGARSVGGLGRWSLECPAGLNGLAV